MTWTLAKFVGLVVGTASGLAARSAAADAAGANATFRLAWVRGDGGEACIDQRELERRVRERLGRDPFDSGASQSIEGDIAFTAGIGRAKLRVRAATGAAVGERALEVPAADCAGLTEAVVLAVALVIDPRASLAPGTSAAAPAASALTPRVSERPLDDTFREPCPPVARRACPPCRAEACPEAAHSSLYVTLRALGTAGLLPTVAPGVAISAAMFGPRLWLTGGMSFLPEQDTGNFAFGLSTADLGACVSADAILGAIPSLCGQVRVGAMHAVVRELAPLRPGDHAWAAVELGPVMGLRPHGAWLLQGGVLGVIPVVRPRFALRGSNETVFESEALGGVAFVGLGIFVP